MFFDPHHGNCIRRIYQIEKNLFAIVGPYGNDEQSCYNFLAFGHFVDDKKYNFRVEFKYKKDLKHKNILMCDWKKRSIKWEDGNEWKQMFI